MLEMDSKIKKICQIWQMNRCKCKMGVQMGSYSKHVEVEDFKKNIPIFKSFVLQVPSFLPL